MQTEQYNDDAVKNHKVMRFWRGVLGAIVMLLMIMMFAYAVSSSGRT